MADLLASFTLLPPNKCVCTARNKHWGWRSKYCRSGNQIGYALTPWLYHLYIAGPAPRLVFDATSGSSSPSFFTPIVRTREGSNPPLPHTYSRYYPVLYHLLVLWVLQLLFKSRESKFGSSPTPADFFFRSYFYSNSACLRCVQKWVPQVTMKSSSVPETC